ncbi:helicase associated domain-containing protein, partial [Vibrio crassostreae]|uniref:helicase associated domain-containing protein n=1 Tax=Vibrio crassostreae TaxID=246167 RepID=UPI001B3148D3
EHEWQNGLKELTEFKKEHGHCNVPQRYKIDKFNLGSWLSSRRTEFKKGNLSKQKVDALNELGVAWDVAEHEWQNGLKELTEFKKEHGHCNVPNRCKVGEFNLGKWLSNRRAEFKKGSISQYKVDELNSLSESWKGKGVLGE